jgi:4-diphosphocytidyl-2-C-methyl-D-erythritol kinase
MKVRAPAKINLFLHVTGRRSDGYHTLFTLMAPVGLYDTLTIDVGPGKIRVACDHPQVPVDHANLAFRAASVFLQHYGNLPGARPQPGVNISIRKQIPLAAGLGGGSSDAAAVLLGLNRHFKDPFARDELLRMGLEVGADVPFFVYGRPAIVTGVGEILEPYPHRLPYHVLLVFPGIRVSTAEVYKNLDLGLTNCEKKLKKLLLGRQAFDAVLHTCNDLESFTLSVFPEIAAAKQALMELGAAGALMSGSGSAVFGLFDNLSKARSAKDHLCRHRETWTVVLTELVGDTDHSHQPG